MFGWLQKRKTKGEPVELKIDGMKCGGCVRNVTSTLERLPGVRIEQVEVGRAAIVWDRGQTNEQDLIGALAAAGFQARTETTP